MLKKTVDLFIHLKNVLKWNFLKYGLGIDMAKEKFDACISIIDNLQRVMIRAQCSFNNNKKGFEAFVEWSRKTHIQHD